MSGHDLTKRSGAANSDRTPQRQHRRMRAGAHASGRHASKVVRSGRAWVWRRTGEEGRWRRTGGAGVRQGCAGLGRKGGAVADRWVHMTVGGFGDSGSVGPAR
jgi:hypothetical protein